MLLAITPKCSVASVDGLPEGRERADGFRGRANNKCKFGNRKSWSAGYCMPTVGLNEAAMAKYIRGQGKSDIALDRTTDGLRLATMHISSRSPLRLRLVGPYRARCA